MRDWGQGSVRILRRYGWLVLFPGLFLTMWLLNVTKAGTHPEGCLQGCSMAGERRDGPLRVMSLNVLHGYPKFEHLSRRLDLITREIRRQDADIVCLQEVPWTRRLGSGAMYLSQRAGLNYLYLRANGNRHYAVGRRTRLRHPPDSRRSRDQSKAGSIIDRLCGHNGQWARYRCW